MSKAELVRLSRFLWDHLDSDEKEILAKYDSLPLTTGKKQVLIMLDAAIYEVIG
ncbi:MAG: hypothetical protein K8R11_00560 [Methanococcoides sp.]|nr:hypothetical protein [Methanococcoides sp.]